MATGPDTTETWAMAICMVTRAPTAGIITGAEAWAMAGPLRSFRSMGTGTAAVWAMVVVACTVRAAIMARDTTTTATVTAVLATTAAAITTAFARVSGMDLALMEALTTTVTTTTRTAMAHAGVAITTGMALVTLTVV